jgi:hypothetical protein
MAIAIRILHMADTETVVLLRLQQTNVDQHGHEIHAPITEYHHQIPGYHQGLKVCRTGEEVWMDQDQIPTGTEKEIAIAIVFREVET